MSSLKAATIKEILQGDQPPSSRDTALLLTYPKNSAAISTLIQETPTSQLPQLFSIAMEELSTLDPPWPTAAMKQLCDRVGLSADDRSAPQLHGEQLDDTATSRLVEWVAFTASTPKASEQNQVLRVRVLDVLSGDAGTQSRLHQYLCDPDCIDSIGLRRLVSSVNGNADMSWASRLPILASYRDRRGPNDPVLDNENNWDFLDSATLAELLHQDSWRSVFAEGDTDSLAHRIVRKRMLAIKTVEDVAELFSGGETILTLMQEQDDATTSEFRASLQALHVFMRTILSDPEVTEQADRIRAMNRKIEDLEEASSEAEASQVSSDHALQQSQERIRTLENVIKESAITTSEADDAIQRQSKI
ncbi:MAG: hypothetical protein GY826_15620, partial [Fuerstiella sp.]|nr:hypothetical protein [Fuerstiella sp.]